MRLPILCGILGTLCAIGVHDFVELKTAQKEQTQAYAAAREMSQKLNWFRYRWKPPFGYRGKYKSLSWVGQYQITDVVWNNETDLGNGRRTTKPPEEIEWGFGKGAFAEKDFIRVDSESRVILSPESIAAIVKELEVIQLRTYGLNEKNGLWNRLRVDGKGDLVLSQESIDAIAIHVLKIMKSNEDWKGGDDPIVFGRIETLSSALNRLEAQRLCVVCGKQKTRDFHGGLVYKAINGNTGSLCATLGCDYPYIPYCDDHSPEKEAPE